RGHDDERAFDPEPHRRTGRRGAPAALPAPRRRGAHRGRTAADGRAGGRARPGLGPAAAAPGQGRVRRRPWGRRRAAAGRGRDLPAVGRDQELTSLVVIRDQASEPKTSTYAAVASSPLVIPPVAIGSRSRSP